MNPILLAFGVALVIGLLAGKDDKPAVRGPRTDDDCLRFMGEYLYETTVTAAAPEQRAAIVASLRSMGLNAAADCIEQNAANLAPCRDLIIAAVRFDIETRSGVELYELEQQARAAGAVEVADCLEQLQRHHMA